MVVAGLRDFSRSLSALSLGSEVMLLTDVLNDRISGLELHALLAATCSAIGEETGSPWSAIHAPPMLTGEDVSGLSASRGPVRGP